VVNGLLSMIVQDTGLQWGESAAAQNETLVICDCTRVGSVNFDLRTLIKSSLEGIVGLFQGKSAFTANQTLSRGDGH